MSWDTTQVRSSAELRDALSKHEKEGWLFRGHSIAHGTLTPSIDRGRLKQLERPAKLDLELRSISTFRDCAKHLIQGEEDARKDNFVALMVLRHHGVPNRLLDWSMRWPVATFFAAEHHAESDGEIWAFSEPAYRPAGEQQWVDAPENTDGGTGKPGDFNGNLTFFNRETSDWFICLFYKGRFPRLTTQHGAFTVAARFSRDHADSIENLVPSNADRRRYIVPSRIKQELLGMVATEFKISRAGLFPDTAGAALTAGMHFPRV